MDPYERLVEFAIELIAAGGNPPAGPIPVPEGDVAPFVPTTYRIPANFPNPPPAAPLTGLIGVRFVLAQCGLDQDQTDRFTALHVTSLEDLSEAREHEVDNHIKLLARTSVARGGVILGLSVTSKIKAAASYLHELARTDDNGTCDAYLVSIPKLRAWQLESRAMSDTSNNVNVTPPSAFDPKDWVSFKDGMVNYLLQVRGARGIPLFYVIRGDERPVMTNMSYSESRIWTASHSGTEYELDNMKVNQILVTVFRGSEGWTYVAETIGLETGSQDGRAAWKRTCRHYDGPHAVETRVALATADLAQLYYKSEAVFPMERYVTRMSNCFRILAQNGAPKSTRDKVKLLLDNIKNPNATLLSFIAQIKTNIQIKQDFQLAANLLLEAVSSTASLHEQLASGSNRRVSNVKAKRNNSGGGGSSKKKKGGGRGGGPPKGPYTLEERNGKKYCNGIDITDPKRTFTYEEYGKMGDYIPILKAARKVSSASSNQDDDATTKRGNKSGGNGSRFGSGGYDD